MKKRCVIRELEAKDIKFIRDVMQDSDFIFAVPPRYQTEKTSYEWYASYAGNFGNAIRTVMEDEEGFVIAMMTVSSIDFNRGTGFLDLYIINGGKKSAISRGVKAFLGNVNRHLGIKELYCSGNLFSIINDRWSDHCIDMGDYATFHSIITKEYIGMYEINEVEINIPDYCIDFVSFKEEKQYILNRFDDAMFHPLSRNPDCAEITSKIVAAAEMLVAYNCELLGFVAFYANDISRKMAYISSIAVKKESRSKGIGQRMLRKSMEIAKNRGMETLCLEVNCKNERAIQFYKREGFTDMHKKSVSSIYMCKEL